MRISEADKAALRTWYLDEIDASVEDDPDDDTSLEEVREACRKAAIETLAHRASHAFDGDKASRGETAGGLTEYVVREFIEIFGREPAYDNDEDWSIIKEAREEAE